MQTNPPPLISDEIYSDTEPCSLITRMQESMSWYFF